MDGQNPVVIFGVIVLVKDRDAVGEVVPFDKEGVVFIIDAAAADAVAVELTEFRNVFVVGASHKGVR